MDKTETKDGENLLRRKVRAASYTDGGQVRSLSTA